ncbi:MAG: hypothetical protein HRT61_08270 [Ekhidna sp.]|nr:hypothetical protein [Ekhidna sp.]
MEFVLKALFDIVVGYLLAYPGALIIWLFSNKERSFKEIYREDVFWNSLVGGLLVSLVILAIYFALR